MLKINIIVKNLCFDVILNPIYPLPREGKRLFQHISVVTISTVLGTGLISSN